MGAIDKPLYLLRKFRLGVLLLSMAGASVMSYFVFGPFIGSPAYKWLQEQSMATPLLKQLIDPGAMLVDVILRSITPLLAVWALAFFLYPKLKSNLGFLNSSIKLVNMFISGPSSVLLLIGSGILGVGIYAYVHAAGSIGLHIATIAFLFFLTPGALLRFCKFQFIRNNGMLSDELSITSGYLFGSLALIGYVSGILLDPVRTVLSICELYPCR